MKNIECPVLNKEEPKSWKDISDLPVLNEVEFDGGRSVSFRGYNGFTAAQVLGPCGKTIFGDLLTTYREGGPLERSTVEKAECQIKEEGYDALCQDCPQNL
ncbi:hypothetical protein ISS07_05140 [Candidatus Woesearchaeota archaeon]|nr:hypothetical protein [Candidatus Woesearchaeota archaeon]